MSVVTIRRMLSRCAATIELAVRSRSEVAAQGLLALDRFEKRLEVPFAETDGSVPLDHLEEERGPVLCGFRKDLEEISLLVAVGEDAQPPQIVPVLADLAHALARVVVVRLG